MQGADRVNDELEVGYDERFERRWLWGQRVGRIVMVGFTLAGLSGLLGRGPFSHRTVSTAASGLSVDFEPIARSQTDTQVTLHVSNDTNSPTEEIYVGSNTVEPMGLKGMIPQPVATKMLANGLVFTVAVLPGTQDAKLRIMLNPISLGSNDLVASINGRTSIHWVQFVLP